MDKMQGIIVSVNTVPVVGWKKDPRERCRLLENFGMEEDAHAGAGLRQVSLLAQESIETIRAEGLNVQYGDFAENLATEGVMLHHLPPGTRLRVGERALLEVTRIGKECHSRCHIFHTAGDCVMPREGVFAKVLEAGDVVPGDSITILSDEAVS